jgi:hypothetical protein
MGAKFGVLVTFRKMEEAREECESVDSRTEFSEFRDWSVEIVTNSLP